MTLPALARPARRRLAPVRLAAALLAVALGAGACASHEANAYRDATSAQDKLSAAIVESSVPRNQVSTIDGEGYHARQTRWLDPMEYLSDIDVKGLRYSLLDRGAVRFIQFEDAPAPGLEARTCYRLTEDSEVGKALTGMFDQPAQQQRAGAQIRDALSDIVEVGRESVDGVDTTHFSASLDVDRYTSSVLGGVDQETADSAGQVVSGLLGPTMQYWVDDDGLIRRSSSGTMQTTPTSPPTKARARRSTR